MNLALFAVMVSASASGPAVAPDMIRVELGVGGNAASGFQIDATERVETLVDDPRWTKPVREARKGAAGSFARMKAELAPFRNLAGEACTPGPADVLQYRLIWREAGIDHTAVFADSCKGFPVELNGRMRALADIFDFPQDARDTAGSASQSQP